jgi:hypothetical protein
VTLPLDESMRLIDPLERQHRSEHRLLDPRQQRVHSNAVTTFRKTVPTCSTIAATN